MSLFLCNQSQSFMSQTQSGHVHCTRRWTTGLLSRPATSLLFWLRLQACGESNLSSVTQRRPSLLLWALTAPHPEWVDGFQIMFVLAYYRLQGAAAAPTLWLHYASGISLNTRLIAGCNAINRIKYLTSIQWGLQSVQRRVDVHFKNKFN